VIITVRRPEFRKGDGVGGPLLEGIGQRHGPSNSITGHQQTDFPSSARASSFFERSDGDGSLSLQQPLAADQQLLASMVQRRP
jgi:hypothetical protein